jgi:DNA repair protein RadA/Sms
MLSFRALLPRHRLVRLATHQLRSVAWLPTPRPVVFLSSASRVASIRTTTCALGISAASSSGGGKQRIVFLCTDCGDDFMQSHGKCPSCGTWGSLKPYTPPGKDTAAGARSGGGAAQRALARTRVQSPAALPAASTPAASRRARPEGWVTSSSSDADGDVGLPQPLSQYATPPPEGAPSSPSSATHARWSLAGPLGAELSRVLGGGVVPGSLTLIGGDPGVGKSTLLLQLAQLLAQSSSLASSGKAGEAEREVVVLYVSAEENARQVGARAARVLGGGESSAVNDRISICCVSSVDKVLEHMAVMRPAAVIVDSIQTVYLEDAAGSSGSVSQVRECATALLHAAKGSGIAVFLVGHVTKSGDVAGPKTLEHLVDAVLYLHGDSGKALRLLRGVKNRYGPTHEVAMFDMQTGGLQPVTQPGGVYLTQRDIGDEEDGAVSASDVATSVTVTLEGTRPVLMELQALCAPAGGGGGGDEDEAGADGSGGGVSASGDAAQQQRQYIPPRRSALGIKPARLYQLLAVLSKRGLGGSKYASLGRHDVYVNVLGGATLEDPAGDLAICAAVAAAFYDVPLPRGVAYVAEVGLAGELRSVPEAERRCQEALRWGFTRVITAGKAAAAARSNRGKAQGEAGDDTRIVRCETLRQALTEVLGMPPQAAAPSKQQSSKRRVEG